MKIWLLTDTHFGHNKMVEYCGRPENHSELILEHISKMVGPEDDMVIHLGDVCIGKDDEWHTKLMYLIPDCFKVLVRGNHDNKSLNWYLEHGWNIVESELLIQHKGKKILFTHEPVPKVPNTDLNIHGHMHNNAHRMDDDMRKWYDPKYNKLLAIEDTHYSPVLLESML